MRTTLLLILFISSLFAGSSYVCRDNHYVMSLYVNGTTAKLNGKEYKYFAEYFWNRKIYRNQKGGFTFNGKTLVVPIREGKLMILKCNKLK